MPSEDEMMEWAARNAQPAGRKRIREEFGVSQNRARRIAQKARKALAEQPIEVEPPALTSIRKFDPTDPAFRGPVIDRLRKPRGAMSLPELAEFLGTGEHDARLMLRSLKSSGYLLEEIDGRYSIGRLRPDTEVEMKDFDRLRADTMEIGIVADSHLSNMNQRLDVLEAAYEEFKRKGVTDVFHAGNLIDGYRERINADEIYFRNCTDQCNYAADNYPSRSGITTYFITGDCHEGWYAKRIGLNIGHYIEDTFGRHGRDDLQYIGHVERDIALKCPAGRAVMRLFHPKGGSSYAQSYKAQKIVRAYQGGEKPAILIIGHFHKSAYFTPRGVHVLLAGCCSDQTRWMRSKGIEAQVAFSTLTIAQDEQGGIARIIPNIVPFYDKGYHFDAGEWESAIYRALKKE